MPLPCQRLVLTRGTRAYVDITREYIVRSGVGSFQKTFREDFFGFLFWVFGFFPKKPKKTQRDLQTERNPEPQFQISIPYQNHKPQVYPDMKHPDSEPSLSALDLNVNP